MSKEVTIIDYDAGNIFNLFNSLSRLNCKVKVTSNLKEIEASDRLIIPGVGAFREGIKNLEEKKLTKSIKIFAEKNKPMLGICLGMQYLMDYSEEFGKTEGLKLINGNVKKFHSNEKYRIPHIGWNYLNYSDDEIFSSLKKKPTFYFCHSYFVHSTDPNKIIGKTEYAENEFCSVIRNKNIYGCQFHPERSGKDGEFFLKNFINI